MYYVTGAYEDGRIAEERTVTSQRKAIQVARKMRVSPFFEGASVRVITEDGELVWRCDVGQSRGSRR